MVTDDGLTRRYHFLLLSASVGIFTAKNNRDAQTHNITENQTYANINQDEWQTQEFIGYD